MLKRVYSSNSAYQLSLFFVGLMFLLPFVITHHEQPMPSFYQEWLAGALGLIALLPLLLSPTFSRDVQVSFKIPRVSLIFLGLTIVLCLQWSLGMLHSNQYALIILSYLIWAFLLVLLGSALRQTLGWEKFVTTLAWCLVIAGIVNIGIVVLQFVILTGGVIPFLPNLSNGALSQANHFADFCALASASLIYLYAKGNFSKSFFYLLLSLFIGMLSLSGSRSVWLYLTAFTVLISMTHLSLVKKSEETERSLSAWRAGLLLLPIFILVQLFIYYFVPNELANLPTERLINSVNQQTSSLRFQFWYDSFRIFLQSPLIGVGVGKLMINTFLLLDTPTAMASKRVFENAHNLFLQLSAEMGIGAFLIVFIGLWSWVKSFKWLTLTSESWWLISLLTVLGIHSILEYPLWFSFFLGVAAILLGAGDEKHITINLSQTTNLFRRAILIILLILGTVNLTTMIIANVKLKNWIVKLAYENINDQTQLEWIERNSLLSPYALSMHVMTAGSISRNDVDKETLLHESAMNFRPLGTVAYQYALLLKRQGKNEIAKKQLNRALIAYPGKFNSVLENTQLEYRQEFLNLLAETRPKRVK